MMVMKAAVQGGWRADTAADDDDRWLPGDGRW